MAEPGSTIPAIVILPHNFVSDANNTGLATAAEASADSLPVHASELSTAQWQDVLSNSSALRGWKGQQIDGKLHIQRAPRAALALKDPKPEFEVYDDSFMETQQSSTSLEREMTLKAFTESGIRAALSGGANSLTFGLGTEIGREKEQSSNPTDANTHSTVHGFYNFPRVIIYLEPESLQLSDACKSFFKRSAYTLDKDKVAREFFTRFGGIIATKVTLGGRLCTTQEVQTENKTEVSDAKKQVLKQLTATIATPAGGFHVGGKQNCGSESSEQAALDQMMTRMMVQTQGGDALLAASISDWPASVGSYRYWRVIQQTQSEDILKLLADVTYDTDAFVTVQSLYSHVLRSKLEQAGQ